MALDLVRPTGVQFLCWFVFDTPPGLPTAHRRTDWELPRAREGMRCLVCPCRFSLAWLA